MITQPLIFKQNKTPFTVGAEIEIQIMDSSTLNLIPRCPEILHNIQDPKLTSELFRSMLEVISGICNNSAEAGADLITSMLKAENYAANNNMVFAATGTHPTADYNDRIPTDYPRYYRLLERNQWLARRTAVFGLHVHVGMRNGDECIRFMNFMADKIPLLIALSASSPFWKGKDSGLAAARPTVYESIPTCGTPMLFRDWEEFLARYESLIKLKAIESMKDLWWDIRPSPGYGTLEVRICDGTATIAELTAIVNFIQLLCVWFDYHKDSLPPAIDILQTWILRENKWRAIRHGLDALIIDSQSITNVRMRDCIWNWIEKFEEMTDAHGSAKDLETLKNILRFGTSSDRQKKCLQTTGDVRQVTKFNISEYYARKPSW